MPRRVVAMSVLSSGRRHSLPPPHPFWDFEHSGLWTTVTPLGPRDPVLSLSLNS
eukprot:m.105249 g.105249  ORF g.105249 m.105249 type:complete len:54 (+) comp21001_c0_seq1:174-335(+)